MKHKTFLIGLGITLLFLVLHLLIITDYGFVWDFHYHFFAGAKFFGQEWYQAEPRPLPYGDPDPRKTFLLPYGPLMSVIPYASYNLFHTMLHILPEDVSYHLPIVVIGVFGIGILYFFLKEAIDYRVGLLAALFLALLPRYFGDLHNNMKDIPMAVLFAVNMWLIWRLIAYRRPRDLFAASVGFALAFNTKINSIFIPVVFLIWLLGYSFISLRHRSKKLSRSIFRSMMLFFTYSVLAAALAFCIWAFYWNDPIGQLNHIIETFGIGTNNIEVILNSHWYCSGSTVPWYYPYWYLAITTPIPILSCFMIGILRILRNLRKNNTIEILLLLWFFVPLSRYLIGHIGVIDGIRHFEEVLFPMAGIAAIGLAETIHFIFRISSQKRMTNGIPVVVSNVILFSGMIFLSVWLLVPIISYHPFQITYFNELVGGIKGAFGKYDLDYWGSSQKQAVLWVNKYTPKNAKVTIVMAADIAGTYIRPDLLANLNKYGYDKSDYVILLNRQGFFYRYFYSFEYLLRHTPIHTIETNGVPLVWIFNNKVPQTLRQKPWWEGEDPCIKKYW